MAYTFKQNLANRNNYGNKRDTSSIKYIVIHYTGNDGDTDENNGNYFKNNVVKVSAHYFVDDDSVTQSVPDNYIAYSVGGGKASDCASVGGGKFYGKATNSNTLNIEICDDIRDGMIAASNKTLENVIELTNKKMKEYNIPKENVIRHFDVTGKRCPAYWCGTSARNAKWKNEFLDKLTEASVTPAIKTLVKNGVINSPDYWAIHQNDLEHLDTLIEKLANASQSKKVNSFTDAKKAINHIVECGVINTPDYWVANYNKVKYLDTLLINAANHIDSKFPYRVRVEAKELNVRKGAGTNYGVVETIKDKGVYTIVDEAMNGATKWGLLKSGQENRNKWISLKYTKQI